MKVISLWQPYASLIASGAKTIETRGWRPRASQLAQGQPLAIHASKRWTPAEQRLAFADPTFRRYLAIAEKWGLWRFTQPPLGCVVAVATFAGAMPTEALLPTLSWSERVFGNYAPGRFGWVLHDIRPIKPIPLRGMQGLFDWQPQPGEIVYLDAGRRKAVMG